MLMKQTLSTAIGENRFFSITQKRRKKRKLEENETSEKAISNRQN
jgi:hypothetical protein